VIHNNIWMKENCKIHACIEKDLEQSIIIETKSIFFKFLLLNSILDEKYQNTGTDFSKLDLCCLEFELWLDKDDFYLFFNIAIEAKSNYCKFVDDF